MIQLLFLLGESNRGRILSESEGRPTGRPSIEVGGEDRIRTCGTFPGDLVEDRTKVGSPEPKSGALNRSATSP